ncbi:MAG: NAD(+) synthase, partial [Mesorhizobium sp.]
MGVQTIDVISSFSKAALVINARVEVDRIVQTLREQVFGTLRRRGVVVGLSGGIDSSVVASLCARAFGSDKVLGIFMPERHSSGDSLRLGRSVAAQLGIDTILEDIAPALEAVGAYRRQIEAIQT